MYVQRTRLINYGPIDHLDITFPFEDGKPKPVLLVGTNGSGKSIVLSHVVNGLIAAKGIVYPSTPEVETGKVFKVRSPLYIRTGSEVSFARVDYEDDLFIEELTSVRQKESDSEIPGGLEEQDARAAWQRMPRGQYSALNGTFRADNREKVEGIFAKNCVLYFPSNRFEEPAWLNEENLNTKAEYMDLKHIQGHTHRKIISHSPLRDNQTWLFEVVYDSSVFERRIETHRAVLENTTQATPLPVYLGSHGSATDIYQIALHIVQSVMDRSRDLRFGIGNRLNRSVSVMEGDRALVPNIFQMSSGELALLNLFLSILRDFDLCGGNATRPEDTRGIVVVDEIDLHLHAMHQYEILPRLIRMFPRVQFIVTTHSALFVLGMREALGEDGFSLYSLPQGLRIDPEEFGEFARAYQAFASTSRFMEEVRTAVKDAQRPIVFVEGKTDVQYIQRAAALLGRTALVDQVEMRDASGAPGLKKIWTGIGNLPDELVPQRVVVLHDCEYKGDDLDQGTVFRRRVPRVEDNPLGKGIENLFGRETLLRACEYRSEFIDIEFERKGRQRGETKTIPEKWSVNEDEKTSLCEWICENGTRVDFRHFTGLFALLEGVLDLVPTVADGINSQGEQGRPARNGSK